MLVPDPNGFGGSVQYRLTGETEWTEEPRSGYNENTRGIGPADMAYAIRAEELIVRAASLPIMCLKPCGLP